MYPDVTIPKGEGCRVETCDGDVGVIVGVEWDGPRVQEFQVESEDDGQLRWYDPTELTPA